MQRRSVLLVFAGLLAACPLGCDDSPEPVVEPEARVDEPEGPRPYPEPEVEEPDNSVPVAYVPSSAGDAGPGDRVPSGSGGGGRGGSFFDRRPPERWRAAADAVRDMSPAQVRGHISTQLARPENAGNGCARLLGGFMGVVEATGERPEGSRGLDEMCARMPAHLQVCFLDPSQRSDAENARCRRLMGGDELLAIASPTAAAGPTPIPPTTIPTPAPAPGISRLSPEEAAQRVQQTPSEQDDE